MDVRTFFYTEITVMLNDTFYTVDEDAGILQLPLLLSNPSSFVETVQVINTDITADGTACTSECSYICSLHLKFHI